jgi:predicted DNA-binding transcriptional regulator AlpA
MATITAPTKLTERPEREHCPSIGVVHLCLADRGTRPFALRRRIVASQPSHNERACSSAISQGPPRRCDSLPERACPPRCRPAPHSCSTELAGCQKECEPADADETINELETAQERWTSDKLLSVVDIRAFFKLGRTAAYEMTRRPGFPEPVVISPRCYRWWASEVEAFAISLPRERTRGCSARMTRTQKPHPATPPRTITGRVRTARPRKATR